MSQNELRKEYRLKLKTEKNNLIKILEHLDGKTWVNLNKDRLKFDMIEEKCKLIDNRITFNNYYL